MRDGRRHAARWLSERASEREALSRPDGDGDNGFLRGANMPQHSFLGAGQSVSWQPLQLGVGRGRPRIVPLSREMIKVIELQPTILVLLMCFIILKPHHM